MPDTFDRLLGALDGLPDVVSTKPSTALDYLMPKEGRYAPLPGLHVAWLGNSLFAVTLEAAHAHS